MADKKKTTGTQTGRRAMKALFADALRELAEETPPVDQDPHLPRGGIRPGQWDGFPHDNLPPDCPVTVIGRDVSGTVYCLTATGLLRAIERWDMPALVDLFAPQTNYLFWAWPAFGKAKKVEDPETGEIIEKLPIQRVERDKAMTCLITAAAKRPLFDPAAQHRGRGGWQDKGGRFIWHSGGWLWTVERGKLQRSRPAEHDGFLYTRQANTIEPWAENVTQDESPALRILEYLRTWKWERPYLDPVLCLGWLATALMGGALKARPIVFTAGGAGVGKSTLHELLRNVLEGAVITFADTTAAGIYQRVKQDSLPVMVDELESKAGSSKGQAIIDLARIAYTGADMGRGGADHEAVGFKLQLSFLFSAINPPPMTEADRSRMAILNLSRLDHSDGVKGGTFSIKEGDGRMILRQIMDGWEEYQRLLQSWWSVLNAQKLDSRAIDTFGTLLAAAELLVGQEVLEGIGLPASHFDRLGEIIAEATRVERAERLDNWHKCLNHLLDCSIDAWREGVRPTIGGTMDAMGSDQPYPEGLGLTEGQKRLQLAGLSARQPRDPGEGYCLAVPRDNPMLKKLFENTEWQQGGWWNALKQAPTHIVRRNDGGKQTMKINGKPTYCLLVDMGAFQRWAEKEGE